ncbi:ribonuclease P protein component 2 [Halovivax asiaticus JCM 14624]|uniref:Ribonuclease P protein component 2 n=1 Tax=Halovivax asiaticus JCM 14624 TaxID=1227490 RepID=M0B8S6_9EURY|nr:ribonuclease P protein component 2 [Halovivax asiaticus JCM 14624]
MKHLPKHLRPRWRYLSVGLETPPGESVPRRSFQRECWYAAQNLLGDPGSAAADLTVVAFEFDGSGGGTTGSTDEAGAEGEFGEALVRVRRGETDPARAALACIDCIDDVPVGVHVRGVSGTIRAARNSFLELA